jgi:tripartite-type tricarboxylate transporter receptor subunit TctC
LLLSLCIAAAAAEPRPDRPIRIVTTAIGGGNDLVARFTAQALSERFARAAIVDNRASSVIPGEIVARAAPDGDTLLVASNTLWLGPLLDGAPYDAFRDFAPVSLIAVAPALLVVSPSLAVRSVPELIALARNRPGTLDYASNATGGSAHLAAELFKRMAGVDMVRISYKGNAPALIDLVGGRVHVMFAVASAVSPLVSSGKLRALGVSSAHPTALFPGVPTIASSGVPGYEAATYTGAFVPAGTPPRIVERLHATIVDALRGAPGGDRYLKAGMEPVGSSPETLRSTMKNETMRMAAVIRDIANSGEDK